MTDEKKNVCYHEMEKINYITKIQKYILINVVMVKKLSNN
jgi:hypothetical protein